MRVVIVMIGYVIGIVLGVRFGEYVVTRKFWSNWMKKVVK